MARRTSRLLTHGQAQFPNSPIPQSPDYPITRLPNHPIPPMLGLYVHIPFCAAICNYCNFNRGLFDPALKVRYVDALVSEIGRLREPRDDGTPALEVFAADTLYFGGGTPSLLEPAEISRIIDACRSVVDLASDAEITLEANPESVTTARLAAYRDSGVNRLSFGVQSFRNDELQRLSRLHDVNRARAALAEARRAGFANVSLDLMMWLPGQSVDAVAGIDRWRHRLSRPSTSRCTSSRCIRTRRSRRRWRGRAGPRPPTMMRRRCTSPRWSGSKRPGTSSTRYRMSRGRAGRPATI